MKKGAKSIELFSIRVPVEAVRNLTEAQRFTYYLLGHMFNELNCLQKLISFSLPNHSDHRLLRTRPEFAQALFLFRLASGKVWEATKTIRETKEIAQVLKSDILPHMPGGIERLKSLNKAVGDAAWISQLRNGMGFHFPSIDRWRDHIHPDDAWEDDIVFLSNQSGNTFYDGAETVAQNWMFSQYRGKPPVAAVESMIVEMIDLLRIVVSFLDDAVGAFVSVQLLKDNLTRKPEGKVIAPDFASTRIPFWTAMDKPRAGSHERG